MLSSVSNRSIISCKLSSRHLETCKMISTKKREKDIISPSGGGGFA
jgi:hypothetical protein